MSLQNFQRPVGDALPSTEFSRTEFLLRINYLILLVLLHALCYELCCLLHWLCSRPFANASPPPHSFRLILMGLLIILLQSSSKIHGTTSPIVFFSLCYYCYTEEGRNIRYLVELQSKYSLRKGRGVGVMDKPPHSSQGEVDGRRKEVSLLKNHKLCQITPGFRFECVL